MNTQKNISNTIESLATEVKNLKSEIKNLKIQALDRENLLKNHLLRLASKESIDIGSIYFDIPYIDIDPVKAFSIFSLQSYNFILLDVSKKGFSHSEKIEESLKIELEFLEMRIDELPSKSTPIYVISEKGIRSILACEALYKLGFININHISGGHKFWPGHKSLSLVA